MINHFGNLRHFITLERNTPSTDSDTGQRIESWASVATNIPASVETVSGGETRRGRQMEALTNVLVRMHNPQGAFTVGVKDRLDYLGRKLNIVSAYDPDGHRFEMHIQCREDV